MATKTVCFFLFFLFIAIFAVNAEVVTWQDHMDNCTGIASPTTSGSVNCEKSYNANLNNEWVGNRWEDGTGELTHYCTSTNPTYHYLTSNVTKNAISLNLNSTITFNCRYYASAGAAYQDFFKPVLYLGNASDIGFYRIALTLNGMPGNIPGVVYDSAFMSECLFSSTDSAKKLGNISVSELVDLGWNISILEKVTALSFVWQVGADSVVNYDISNLTVYETAVWYNSSNNTAPTWDYVYDSLYAYMNNSLGYAVWNYSINVTDTENDAVYYSEFYTEDVDLSFHLNFQTANYEELQTEWETELTPWYNKLIDEFLYIMRCEVLDRDNFWGLCNDYMRTLKYSAHNMFWQDLNHVYSQCEISEVITNYDPTTIFYNENVSIYPGWNNKTYYGMTVNGDLCDHDIMIFKGSANDYYTDGLKTYMTIDLSENSEAMVNLRRFWNWNRTEPLYFNRSDATIQIRNSTSTLAVVNNTYLVLEFDWNANTREITYSVSDWYDNSILLAGTAGSDVTELFSMNMECDFGTCFFDDITFYKVEYNISWSSSYDAPKYFYTTGQHVVMTWVTDEYHLSDRTNVKTVAVKVLPETYEEAGTKLKDNFLHKVGYGLFGNLLAGLGLQAIAYSVFWVAFILGVVMLWLKGTDLVRSLSINSFFFTILAFFGFGNNGQLVSVIVLFALTITPNIARVFAGGSNG